MLELWLVRHAESLGNLDKSEADTSLSPQGRAQAELLARRLADERFDRMLSSPLRRARETAELALPGRPVTIDPRLRELVVQREFYMDVSRLALNQLRALAKRDPDEQPVENGKQFMARIRGWVADLPRSGRVIAFTHYGVVRECLRNLVPKARVQTIGFAETVCVRVEGGAGSIFRIG